jgi:hypothetical protein
MVAEGCEGTKKCKRQRRWVQKVGEWEYGSVRSVPSPIYPHQQAAAHRAWCFVPTPCTPHTQALTREPRSCSSIGAGWQNGGAAALKRNARDFRCAVSHRFRDHGHNCLGPRDFHYAITAHEELWRMTDPPGTPNIATCRVNRGSPRINRVAPSL